jgi:ATP-dependent 26S proteasome regulatory subunit
MLGGVGPGASTFVVRELALQVLIRHLPVSSSIKSSSFGASVLTRLLHIVRLLREELGLLQQPGSYVGEVVKVMGSKRVLVKVHPEGKYGRLKLIY